MPAQSKAQQKFMGMVHATQKGEMKPTGAVAKAAKGMSQKSATDFASTKHKGLPGHVKKEGHVEEAHSMGYGGDVDFYIVLDPEQVEEEINNANYLVRKSDPIAFAKDWGRGAIEFNEIFGFYFEKEEAEAVAEELLNSIYEKARQLEEKKSTVTDKLQKRIDILHKEAEHHMKMAKKEPEEAEKHRELVKALMDTIKDLQGKHKAVEESKKVLKEREKPGKEEKKEEKKEDKKEKK
jgi:hypothetical protein